ncbi:MAG: histidine kinase [Paludibaculum sp.]
MRVLLDSFSAICFTLMAALCLREHRRRSARWGGTIYVWTAGACAVHFLYRSTRFFLGAPLASVAVTIDLCVSFFLPALLFHLIYSIERERMPWRVVWNVCLIGLYGLGATGAAVVVLQQAPGRPVEDLRALTLALLGVAALLASVLAASSRRIFPSGLERSQRRWLMALCGVLAAVALLRMLAAPLWLLVLQDTVPLVFVFAVTYSVERFTFFDVLLKKGALAFCALLALTLFFVCVAPWLLRHDAGLAFPLCVWPIVLAYPWFNRRMSAWLDRICLGRRFSPTEASKHFLAGLQGALSEEELAQRAGSLLGVIFPAQAEVLLGGSAQADGASSGDDVHLPVLLHGEIAAEIRLRAREPGSRFLSEDMTLLASLADSFAFLLENLQLRDKRLEQEKRVRELELSENRLALKALRAQVNPHFLFNALNTIAGLIPRHPARAEQTIEQLAEVFRFTLRRMDREWVRVEEEIEAVRAYLDVEQARFGDRLRYRIEMSQEAGRQRIPAMIVQTLVENAVKHGISAQTAPGCIEVAVALRDDRISIEVRDSGPGFGEGPLDPSDDGGRGLRNIRDRLRGYFGDRAELRTGRDEERGMTLAGVELPRFAELPEGVLR